MYVSGFLGFCLIIEFVTISNKSDVRNLIVTMIQDIIGDGVQLFSYTIFIFSCEASIQSFLLVYGSNSKHMCTFIPSLYYVLGLNQHQ